MSIAQLDVGAYGSPDGPGDSRLPPQDVHAEQSVLGGMLLSKDAIGDVAEQVKSSDFYRPAHELIYDAVIDLFSRGEPVDAITVADELTKRGTLQRVGGQAYLHDLIQSVPTAANAGYYANIVAERAVLRRLVEAGTRIVQLGYGQGEGDVSEIVNRAQAEVYAVADKRGTEDYVPLSATLEETLNEIEVASGRTDEFLGVPTGFHELDDLLHGLHKGQMIVVAARPAVGKALALDTPLPTPTGWTTMGEVAIGDAVLGADGLPTRVTNATEVLTDRECFEVEFSDGSVIVADAEHQWLTDSRASRRSARAVRDGRVARAGDPMEAVVLTTTELAETLEITRRGIESNHSVKVTAPLALPAVTDLPVSPYALGVALATSSHGGCADDQEVADRVEAGLDDAERAWLAARGADVDLPAAYLRASEEQRRAVLAGLLDGCGEMAGDGEVVLTLTDQDVCEAVVELVTSLGMQAGWEPVVAGGVPAYELKIDCNRDVFTLPRKAMLHKALRGRSIRPRDERFVIAVRPTASVPVRCIEVDNEAHLYLAGRAMIPTHNSTFGMDISRAAAIKHKMATAFFSLEMSRTEISMRVLAAEGTISLQDLRKGTLGDAGWAKLASLVGKISDSPLYIDDSPNMSLMEIRAKCRRLKQQHNLKLVVIDYLQLMSSGKKVESRQQEVSEFSRALKLLAKEIEVPVIAISQLNRGPEQRTDKRPQMSDLRESGCLTADTRILRADTGAESTLGELYAAGARDVEVWAMDEGLRAVRRTMTHVFSTGMAPVFRLTLASGKTVRATENHPFLTYDGWQPLAALRTGSRLAVPRHVLAPSKQGGPLTSPWDESTESDLPDLVFGLPKPEIARLLQDLFSARARVLLASESSPGSSDHNPDGEPGSIELGPVSRDLADKVSRLLLRFGIQTRLRVLAGTQMLDQVELAIDGIDSQRRFLQEIGLGTDHAGAALLLARLRAADGRANQVSDRVWDGLRAAAQTRKVDSGGPLAEVARILDSAALDLAATNDVYWDEVASIEYDGIEEVFDATVPGAHNFVANGITVHNSIEQDADVVILLHKDKEREGEADVLVVKHRNGPTKEITLGFQGHYARFANMAANF